MTYLKSEKQRLMELILENKKVNINSTGGGAGDAPDKPRISQVILSHKYVVFPQLITKNTAKFSKREAFGY